MDLDIEKVARSPIAPAFIGALVSLTWAPGVTLAGRAFNVFSATAVAYYCAPLAIDMLGIKAEGGSAAVAALIGMFGLSLAAAVVAAIKQTNFGQILQGWLERKKG